MTVEEVKANAYVEPVTEDLILAHGKTIRVCDRLVFNQEFCAWYRLVHNVQLPSGPIEGMWVDVVHIDKSKNMLRVQWITSMYEVPLPMAYRMDIAIV